MKHLFLVGLMVLSSVAAFAGGAGEKKGEDAKSSGKVTITHLTGWHGEHIFAGYMASEMERFNKIYGDKIKVELEEIAGPQREAKQQVLIAADSLPDVFLTNDITTPKLAYDAGLLVEMTDYVAEYIDSLSMVELDYFNKATGNPKGTYYGIASHSDKHGYFYNKAMFQKVGITPAKTWDEFWANADKLKKAGYTPVAVQTGGNGFLANLWTLAFIGTTNKAGNAWVNEILPTNWDLPEVVNGYAMLQRLLQNYCTPDVVGLDNSPALNYFLNEKVAILANGPWMISQFSDTNVAAKGLQDRVGMAAFPGNAINVNPGYAMFNAAKTPEKQDAAAAFIKHFNDDEGQLQKLLFLNLIPATPNIDVSRLKINPILAELITVTKGSVSVGSSWRTIPNFLRDTIVQQIPLLVYNQATPKEVVSAINNAAKQ